MFAVFETPEAPVVLAMLTTFETLAISATFRDFVTPEVQLVSATLEI
jgi:hypothetical protein